jgi:integrase
VRLGSVTVVESQEEGMARARRRFGSLRRLPSGRWQVRYRDRAGRFQTAPVTFARKSDAARHLALVEADLERGEWTNPRLGRSTFAEWADDWLATTVHLRARTRAGYVAALRTHVLPAFGELPIARIEQVDVRRLIADLIAGGAAPGTVRGARKVARLVFASAVGSGAIKVNPCDGVRVPRSDRHEMMFLSTSQIEALAEAISPPYGVLIRLAAYTGLRAGEIGALRVGRLDLLRRRIEVVESLAEEPWVGLVFGPPKTYERRAVALPPSLCEELAAYLADRPREPDALVFGAPEGGPLRHRNFYRRQFRPAVAAAGLPERTRFHDLRHTCAALLIAQGAHPLAVMQRLGHSSITVTMNTYGHLFPELDEALTEGLDAAYRAARDANRESVVARQWHGAPQEGGAVVDMQARNTV